MAGLGLGLGISSGTVSSGDAVTPTPGRNTTFGRLLTQDDDFILTQDGKFFRGARINKLHCYTSR